MRNLIAALLLLTTSGAAVAAPILIESDGELAGATGVDVGGVLYDVTFLDGSCISLFSGCDEASDFDFTTEAGANQASQALLDQVLVNTASGAYDDLPGLTAGCEPGSDFCGILTPYEFFGDLTALGSAAVNRTAGSEPGDDVLAGTLTVDIDTGTDPFFAGTRVYADWSRTVAVPEPGTLGLFGFGLAFLGGSAVRRRRLADT